MKGRLHDEGCAQSEKVSCPSGTSLHDEPADQHWWSGWPGAFCMKCGAEDKDEVCIGNACGCHCHDEFDRAFIAAMGQSVFGITGDTPHKEDQ